MSKVTCKGSLAPAWPAAPAMGEGRPPRAPELERLACALDRTPAPVVIANDTGVIKYANPAVAGVTGFCPDELIGLHVSVLRAGPSPDDATVWETLSQGGSWRSEQRGKRKDGREFWASISLSPIRDACGRISYVLGIGDDITSYKSDQPAPPAETGPDMVLVTTTDGTILFIDRTVPGITREEAIGSTVFDYVPPEYHGMLRQHMRRVARTKSAVSYEIPSVGPHGSTSIYTTQVGPIERDGEVVALSFITYDITDRKRLHSALQESEARSRSLSRAPIEAVAVHENGVVLDANLALALMYGYELSEVIGMAVRDLAAPESRELVLRNIDGGGAPHEALALRKDGTTFPVEICSEGVVYRGRPARAITIRDISQRPQADTFVTAAPVRRRRAKRRPGRPAPELSGRELEVLELLARGLTNKEVAEGLRVSTRTVDHHVSHILNKLHAPNRTAAVVTAKQAGILEPQSPRRNG